MSRIAQHPETLPSAFSGIGSMTRCVSVSQTRASIQQAVHDFPIYFMRLSESSDCCEFAFCVITNFCRVYCSTPAIRKEGLADHVWSIAELLGAA